jgi:hypothetical protein
MSRKGVKLVNPYILKCANRENEKICHGKYKNTDSNKQQWNV